VPTPAQFKAARALLGWSQAALANAAGLSPPSVKRLELEYLGVSEETALKACQALEAAGIEFIGKTGANLKKKPRP
jgi:transcriptional regulator with XRE-family HTH domain